MEWIKKSDDRYIKYITRMDVLECIKHESYSDIWWEIKYDDGYIDKYIEIGEDEIDINNIEKILTYADEWFNELVDNIIIHYTNLKEKLDDNEQITNR